MTWSRFDDAARKHPKAEAAGNEAWGLWCAAIMYCNQYSTDGFVSDGALAGLLPCPISKAKAKALAEKLREAGLFEHDAERGGYIVHDFLHWNPSKAETEDKRKKDRVRKRGLLDSARNPPGDQRESGERNAGTPADSEFSTRAPVPRGARAPVPPALPEKEEPPTPSPEDEPEPAPTGEGDEATSGIHPAAKPANTNPGTRRTDRPKARDPWTHRPADREDVQRLHARWKDRFGMHGHKFRRADDLDAETLAEALDAHGESDCNVVCDHANNDRMVNGTGDERGLKHDSIKYIFGNPQTFARILREAQKQIRASEESIEDRFARLEQM